MQSKVIVGIVVVLVLVVGAVVYNNMSSPVATQPVAVAPVPQAPVPVAPAAVSVPTPAVPVAPDITTAPVVKSFTVTGKNFSFEPKTLAVAKGDTVKITLNNVEGFHDLKIDEFQAATKHIQAGQQDTIQFVADKSGAFEFYCSVGEHRQMGMTGTLTVK